MPNAALRPYVSAWGHCASSPDRSGSAFMRFLDACVTELLSA